MKQWTVEETLSHFPSGKHTDSSNLPLEAANSAGERRHRFATRKYLRKLRNVDEDTNKKAHK